MYTLYTDKSEDFKCKISVEGSKISDTTARLVIENEDVNLLLVGKIDSDGNCTVPIKKMKTYLPEGSTGKIKLEVISEDTFFSPWEDDYVIKTNKKITVEMTTPKEPIKENRIKVEVIPQSTKKIPIVEKKLPTKTIDHGKIISEHLTKRGITVSNITEHKDAVIKTIKEYMNKNNVKLNTSTLLDEIVNNLNF